MNIWQSIVLGIIQGLTEFLPVSSTAHLRVVPSLLGWEDPGAAYSAVIQLGTLFAVVLYFRDDIAAILLGVLRDPTGRGGRMGWMILAGTLPIIVFGLALKPQIEHHWRSLYVVAAALIGMAVVLAVAEWLEKRRQQVRDMASLSWRDAIVVGFFQALALVPGASRSGSTIAGGLFLGLSRETAARFSFLLSLPAISLAGLAELYSARHDLLADGNSIVQLAVATVVSFAVGYASIGFLLGYLRRHTTWVFIVYRIALGVVLLALLARGTLAP
jgi:undecaprenyl-diphosphatase